MCGIAGIMTTGGGAPDPTALDRLTDALAHRGPDGRGRFMKNDIGLVQTRLAIIDLETGDQPLYEPGGAVLVGNAEIYNYIELRAGLDGVDFQTGSDCEPALHLYRRRGMDFAEELRGMYALAIYDPAERRLLLARDPFGIKPLYYVEIDGLFAFASEPQALLAAGLVRPRLRSASLQELLQLQFTTGRETVYADISRVLPGETLAVAQGRIVERRRRAALPLGGRVEGGEEEALRRLDAALEDSVAMHQRSDVPYAMFLSGGIDSSALLALMARLNERPVCAFTAGFSGTAAPDERRHARAVAGALGAEHVEVEFAERDFWSLLPAIAAAMDDPAADYAVLPSYKLAAEAARAFKVVLCGEGGDELFAGYGRYRSLLRPMPFGIRALRRKGTFDRVTASILREAPDGWRDAGGAGGGLRRLAAQRPADQARPLPDGAWRRGADALSRPHRRRSRLPPARRDEGAPRAGQMAVAPMAGPAPAGGAAVPGQTGVHGPGRRMDPARRRAPGPAGRGPAGHRRDLPSGADGEAVRRVRPARRLRRLDAAVLCPLAPPPCARSGV
jgi:asparagine synthase (glutamine-hydrolysing)